MLLRAARIFTLYTIFLWPQTALSQSSQSLSRDGDIPKSVALHNSAVARLSSYYTRALDSNMSPDQLGNPPDPASNIAKKQRIVGACRLCRVEVTFETSKQKIRHLLEVHGVKHECPDCKQSFDRDMALQSHRDNEEGCRAKLKERLKVERCLQREDEENRRCPHPDCAGRKLFPQKKHRNRHIRRQHENSQGAQCLSCGKWFNRKQYLHKSHKCPGLTTNDTGLKQSVSSETGNHKNSPAHNPEVQATTSSSYKCGFCQKNWSAELQSVPLNHECEVFRTTLPEDEMEKSCLTYFLYRQTSYRHFPLILYRK